MARPVSGAVDPLKRSYGGARRGSHHVTLPFLGKPSRKSEEEERESCDSEEEGGGQEVGGGRKGKWLSTPASRPLGELQENKGREPVKALAPSYSRTPLCVYKPAQQENLTAPSIPQGRQRPTPKLNHRDNSEQNEPPQKFATDSNVSLSSATALDGSCSYSAMGLETSRDQLLPPLPSLPPHSSSLAHSSRMQSTVISKREVPADPAPELHHAGQGSSKEEVDHPQEVKADRSLFPPDLHSQDWLALPDTNKKKKWVIKVSHLGRGGFSEVFKVYSVEDRELYALKVVSLNNPAMEEALANEIRILRKLQGHPQIVQLKDFFLDRDAMQFYVLLELGSLDLAQLIRKKRDSGCYAHWMRALWWDMLVAVKTIHDQNVVHSDLKPANFLMVGSQLKLIDFGISNKLQDDCTSVLKDLRCGTFNYMAPEMLQAQDKEGEVYKVGRYSDIWSLGCILYLMVYGKTPFQELTNQMQKFFAIVSPTHQIQYPPHSDEQALQVIKSCLQRSMKARPTAAELLKHPFVTSLSPS